MLNDTIRFFLENRLITILIVIVFLIWGIVSSPFIWQTTFLPSDPVPVDAIPDIGENQQIVFSEWPGRSPQDIDDQISYPLTTALLGIPGVKTIRSHSVFGFSSIYLIFDDDVEFYWSRSRIIEKLNSLAQGTLPEGVTPTLGPDATALGQVFWYTLEGRDKHGNPADGWDPHELRTIQDFYVKYALSSAAGVAEVASIGGYVKEYQVDIDPNAMKASFVTIADIMAAVRKSNQDVGAKTIEVNRVEYMVRSIGYIKSLDDLAKSVVAVNNNIPIRLSDVASIQFGPASRRGGLDKNGAEAVGGVVVARYGANPLEVINKVKEKIAEISPGLPSRILEDGTVSKLTLIPFYDRSGLIHETLGTLEEALSLEILITIIVVLVLVFNLRTSLLISGLLPLGVLMTFVAMRQFGIDANIVALSGIAIAIGVMVDVGIVISENIVRHLEMPQHEGVTGQTQRHVIHEATIEVAPAVITAIATTIVSFLPVFALQAAEGKLFSPLAFTKTFGMLSALAIGLIIIPTMAAILFSIRIRRQRIEKGLNILLMACGILFLFWGKLLIFFALTAYGLSSLLAPYWPGNRKKWIGFIHIGIILFIVVHVLSRAWSPLGAGYSDASNFLFVATLIALILGFLSTVIRLYPRILNWALAHKPVFMVLPIVLVITGIIIWQGFDRLLSFMPETVRRTSLWQTLDEKFPGIGKEFMPALDEGSFLLMPTTMPHAGVEENIEMIAMLDKRISNIPEVELVVGKWGRANSALDPAPVSMFENVINYRSEYVLDNKGYRRRFHVDKQKAFVLKNGSVYKPKRDPFRVIDPHQLIPDKNGLYFRQWRPHIHNADDIWNEIVAQTTLPGLTSAPRLQPIQTRLIMLQTGMRAPMGYKVFGPNLEQIEKLANQLEHHLKEVEGVEPMSVFADRIVGKPYLEIHLDRESMGRYGLTVQDFQAHIASAIGGMTLTTTVEGRERFPVRVRYAREYRDNPEDLKNVLIPTALGSQVPLGDLARIQYTRGPQLIKSENTFLVGYVIFDKKAGYAEVDVIQNTINHLTDLRSKGLLQIPAGVHYSPTGNYENELRATRRLLVIVPLALLTIFLILYLQFKSIISTSLIFSGILVAFSGGFIMLWLYGQSWFMNFSIFSLPVQDILQINPVNLSVAVWVGFIALFGIASDDGVLISTYLKQLFDKNKPRTVEEIRALVLEAGLKRARPAIMTTATTLIALLPVLSSRGKGSDIMVPMAIPIFGGMVIATLTIFIVPVLYSLWQERRISEPIKNHNKRNSE